MRKKSLISVGLVLVVLAVALFAFSREASVTPGPDTVAADRGNVVATVGATGTVEAVSTVQVGTQVSGIIWKIYADFNSKVKKDHVVARLEPSLFESRLTEARANMASAEANVERAKVSAEDARHKLARARELSAQALLPQSDLDVAELAYEGAGAELKQAEAQLQQTQAAVEQAEVNLEHTVIRSPIDGVVIARNVEVGQTVSASLQAPTLFTIAEDLSKMRVVASVDEADVGMIASGQKARFRVDAFPEDEFEGTISQLRLDPITVQNVVTYNALVDVENMELKLRPGMTANITVDVARKENVLRVPNAAFRYRPDPALLDIPGAASSREKPARSTQRMGAQNSKPTPTGNGQAGPGSRDTVYALEKNGKLRPIHVRVGVTDGSYSEIVQGQLEEGDPVAIGWAESKSNRQVAQERAPSPMRFFGFGSRR